MTAGTREKRRDIRNSQNNMPPEKMIAENGTVPFPYAPLSQEIKMRSTVVPTM
jgi:hypothetical protein